MKITIWIRPANDGRDMTLRLDTKYESQYESHDTPMIQRYGHKLVNAIEGTADKNDNKENNT